MNQGNILCCHFKKCFVIPLSSKYLIKDAISLRKGKNHYLTSSTPSFNNKWEYFLQSPIPITLLSEGNTFDMHSFVTSLFQSCTLIMTHMTREEGGIKNYQKYINPLFFMPSQPRQSHYIIQILIHFCFIEFVLRCFLDWPTQEVLVQYLKYHYTPKCYFDWGNNLCCGGLGTQ